MAENQKNLCYACNFAGHLFESCKYKNAFKPCSFCGNIRSHDKNCKEKHNINLPQYIPLRERIAGTVTIDVKFSSPIGGIYLFDLPGEHRIEGKIDNFKVTKTSQFEYAIVLPKDLTIRITFQMPGKSFQKFQIIVGDAVLTENGTSYTAIAKRPAMSQKLIKMEMDTGTEIIIRLGKRVWKVIEGKNITALPIWLFKSPENLICQSLS